MAHIDRHHLIHKSVFDLVRQHFPPRITYTHLMLYLATATSLGLVAVATFVVTHAQ